jgi:hypothetical protein
MENYAGAFAARQLDVEALLAHDGPRNTAAVHLAGVTIECRLKELIVAYHALSRWDEPSRRSKDPKHTLPIPRPGHSLVAALKLMHELYRKALSDPRFLTHLDRVNHPTGASAIDFIALRYSAGDLAPASMAEWRKSFEYVLGWLKQNERVTR